MSTKKLKDAKRIQPFEQGAYKMPLALKLALEKAKKQQPELIAISGNTHYVKLD
jgi:hypothetical protein